MVKARFEELIALATIVAGSPALTEAGVAAQLIVGGAAGAVTVTITGTETLAEALVVAPNAADSRCVL